MPTSRSYSSIQVSQGKSPALSVDSSALLTPANSSAVAVTDALLARAYTNPSFLAYTLPSTTTTLGTFTFAGEVIYLGSGSNPLTELFQVTDANNRPLYVSTSTGYTRITVTARTFSAGSTGFLSSGTYSFTTNTAVPSGTVIRIWYLTKNTLAGVSPTSYSPTMMRGTVDVDAQVAVLSTAGLDNFYRKGSSAAAAAGIGGIITRDGGPLTLVAKTRTATAAYHSTWQASFSAVPESATTNTFSASTGANPDGSPWSTSEPTDGPAFVHETPYRNVRNVDEWSRPAKSGPTLLGVIPRHLTAASLSPAGTTYTYINRTSTATLNPSGVGADIVQCAGGQYFSRLGVTAIRAGLDLLVVTVGGVRTSYIIDAVTASNRVRVRTWDDTAPVFSVDTSATIELNQVSYKLGGTPLGFRSSYPTWMYARPFVVAAAPLLTDSPYNETESLPALFLSPAASTDTAITQYSRAAALEVGAFTGDPTTPVQVTQRFFGSGNYEGTIGRARHFFSHRSVTQTLDPVALSNNYTFSWNPITSGSCAVLTISGAGIPALYLTVTLAGGAYTPAVGDRLEFIIRNLNSNVTMLAWPANFLFSGDDARLPETGIGVANVGMYRFSGIGITGGYVLMTRTDYNEV